jgi:hypothetical protein
MKCVHSTWLVIRTRNLSFEIFRMSRTHANEIANKCRNVARSDSETKVRYGSHFALRSGLLCVLWKILLFYNSFVVYSVARVFSFLTIKLSISISYNVSVLQEHNPSQNFALLETSDSLYKLYPERSYSHERGQPL